jgi:hypothetical protein
LLNQNRASVFVRNYQACRMSHHRAYQQPLFDHVDVQPCVQVHAFAATVLRASQLGMPSSR